MLPPFDQPACPRDGYRSATLSFDAPSSADGYYLIEDRYGDITDFSVTLGSLSSDVEALYGGVSLLGGLASGTAQDFASFERFSFDWETRSASYSYDYGYHNPNGSFVGTMYAVPEPASARLTPEGVAALAGVPRRGRTVVSGR